MMRNTLFAYNLKIEEIKFLLSGKNVKVVTSI